MLRQAALRARPPPDTTPSRPSKWAALLARIYEVFPRICPTCQELLTFIAFLTHPEPITRILAHIGEPTSPPSGQGTAPDRTRHRASDVSEETDSITEQGATANGGKSHEVPQKFFPDDLDQSPESDPADPEPIPKNNFDQSWGA